MRDTIVALLTAALLLSGAVVSEVQLRSIGRPEPLGRELLYLPTPEMLKLISLGNEGLMADLMLIWSIQYYSQFQPNDKFLYLDRVYDLITDLDPLFYDAYRLGALIMGIERTDNPARRNAAVARLYDKGLENMPDSWELADTAAWDAYLALDDGELAIRYAKRASEIEGSPHYVKRLYGLWSQRVGQWSIEDSVAYWEDVLSNSTTKFDKTISRHHLYDAYAELHRQQLNPMLAAHRDQSGFCPDDFQRLIDIGWLTGIPLDYAGNPYSIDSESCTLQAHKRIRWD